MKPSMRGKKLKELKIVMNGGRVRNFFIMSLLCFFFLNATFTNSFFFLTCLSRTSDVNYKQKQAFHGKVNKTK